MDATYGIGTVKISNGKFIDNASSGLDVESLRAITLTSIQANENGNHGVYLNNCQMIGMACTGSGNVTITSPAASGSLAANEFNDNVAGSGLKINNNGSIILTNLNAKNNGGHGLFIIDNNSSGNLTINKNLPNWVNEINKNTYHGIELQTHGNVTISDTYATFNFYYGINTDSVVKTVSISRSNFDYNWNYGLCILASGNVTLLDVSASNNDYINAGHYDGAYIDNTYGTGSVTVKSSSTSGDFHFDSNSGNGILIHSKGAVSVSNVSSTSNDYGGLFIYNQNSTGTPAVSLKDCYLSWNAQNGLLIRSRGSVTLTNVRCQLQRLKPFRFELL